MRTLERGLARTHREVAAPDPRKRSAPSSALNDQRSAIEPCACGGKCPKCSSATALVDGALKPLPESTIGVLNEPGETLPWNARKLMEQRFDADFSSVRVHTGAASEQASRDLQARAWSSGEHIVFGRDAFGVAPISRRNRLAHELAHVLEHRKSNAPAGAIDREPLSSRDQRRLDDGKPIEGMDPMTGEFFDGHIDREVTERYLRGLRKGEVFAPPRAPLLNTIPETLKVADCGKVEPGMDPAAAETIRNCITHRRFVNIMAQSTSNMSQVSSTYAAGIASIYDAMLKKVVATTQVPTATRGVDYTETKLSARVSSATTLPISTFTLHLAHLGTGAENGSWSALTNKLTLNETSGSVLTDNQADIERTMYHEMVHFLSDVVTFQTQKPLPGAAPVNEPALMKNLTDPYKPTFLAATTPIFDDMLTKVKLNSRTSAGTWTSRQLALAQWFKVENEVVTRVEEQIYLALRGGHGFTVGDMRALVQGWILSTPEYWDALQMFDRTSLSAYLTSNQKTVERDVIPIVRSIQESYMYLRRPS